MKFTPLSSACLTMGSLFFSSKINGFQSGVPMFMVPSQSRETCRPEWPRRMYFMAATSGFWRVERVGDLVDHIRQLRPLRLAGQRGTDRRAAGVVVVGIHRIQVITGRVDPVRRDNRPLVLGFRRQGAVEQGFQHSLGNPRLGGAPGRVTVQLAANGGLVDVQGHGLDRDVGLGNDHERAMPLAGRCQAVGERLTSRAVARADQDVDMRGIHAWAFKTFADVEVESLHGVFPLWDGCRNAIDGLSMQKTKGGCHEGLPRRGTGRCHCTWSLSLVVFIDELGLAMFYHRPWERP